MTTLQKVQPNEMFTDEQIQIIKDQIAKGATDEELRFFTYVCSRTGLDPMARQIHFVKRYDSELGKKVASFQTGIDGFRSIAERSGLYEGQTAPLYCGEDGVWVDVWLKKTPPLAAKVGVFRKGFRDTIWATARYDAYVQRKADGSPNIFWLKMSDIMLAKCAESLALRKAFPQDLYGLLTDEEMGQANSETVTSNVPETSYTELPDQGQEPQKQLPPAKIDQVEYEALMKQVDQYTSIQELHAFWESNNIKLQPEVELWRSFNRAVKHRKEFLQQNPLSAEDKISDRIARITTDTPLDEIELIDASIDSITDEKARKQLASEFSQRIIANGIKYTIQTIPF